MDFFEQNVRYKEFNDLESTFAFLVLAECEQNRKLLYTKTELYPLLRYRIYFLNAQLKNTKGYMSLIREHEQRPAMKSQVLFICHGSKLLFRKNPVNMWVAEF